MKAESRRVKLTKKMLQDALLELMETHSFSKISIKDLCRTADINRTTFYNNYDSTEDLLHEIEENVLAQIPIPAQIPTLSSHDHFLEKMTEFFDYVQQNKRLFEILIVRSDHSQFRSRLITLIMSEYKSRNYMDDSMTDRFQYYFCLNGFIGAFRQWISMGFPMSSSDFASLILTMSVSATSTYDPSKAQ